jgi:hypothetical protein
LRRTNPCGQPFSRDFQDKRLAAKHLILFFITRFKIINQTQRRAVVSTDFIGQ